MRKIFATVLALLQLTFGVFLIANGGMGDRAENDEIARIRQNGTEFLFSLSSFEYNEDARHGDPPITFSLYSEKWDYNYDYYPLTPNQSGVALYGASVPEPPAEPYYAPFKGKTYCAIDKNVLHELFGADAKNGSHYYNRPLLTPEKNIFNVNNKWVHVFAVGTVYEGNIVFTGIKVDGVLY